MDKINLLDWKLDFTDPEVEHESSIELNQVTTKLTRFACLLTLNAMIQMPIVEYFISGSPILDTRYSACVLIGSSVLLIALVLSFSSIVSNHGAIVCSIAHSLSCFLLVVLDIIDPNNYMYDLQAYCIAIYVLIQGLIYRVRCKHFFIWMTFVFFFRFITFVYINPLPLRTKIGYTIPSFTTMIFGVYIGSFFEKQWKYDFFHRKVMNDEADNLLWSVTRDTSLLRNIFPKNLCDALETQMANFIPKKETTILKSSSFIDRSLSSLATLKAQISHLRELATPRAGETGGERELDGKNGDREEERLNFERENERPIHKERENKELLSANPLLKSGSLQSNESQYKKSPPRRRLSVSIPKNNYNTPVASPISIFTLPPIITTPSPLSDLEFNNKIINSDSFLITRGTPLRTPNHKPEQYTYLSGAHHSDGSRIALSHSYPNVVVLFADIVGFTVLSSSISPHELVTLLNELFSKFDDIMDQYKFEKIRTVGDAYLCVANMSLPLDNAEEEAVEVGFKMIKAVHSIRDNLRLRVGIASGPVIAGVTGLTKWNYDIFGKPLAEATTAEALAPPDCIAITESTFRCIKNESDYSFTKQYSEDFCYLVAEGDQFGCTPRNMPQLNQPDDLSILWQAMPRTSSLNKAVLAFIRDDELDNEISEEEVRTNITRKFSYTKEELAREEAELEKKTMNFKFINPKFEEEVQFKGAVAAHDYTITLSYLFSITSILYLIMDISVSPNGDISEVPPSVVMTYLASALMFLFYIYFVKHYDFHRLSGYVAWVVSIAHSSMLVYVYHITPTETHMTIASLSIFEMGGFVRVPLISLFIGQLTVISVAVSILRTDLDDMKFISARIILTMYTLAFYTLSSQSFVEKTFRKQFLAQKRIKYDMYHQKITQQRSKMLLHNILPEEIIPKLQPSSTLQGNIGVVDLFEEATIMFINITNLEKITADLEPSSRFEVYNDLFTNIDEVTKLAGLEKIKTINSVYMVASGLPKKIPDHVDKAIKLAIQIYNVTSKFTYPGINEKVQVRIGIATGPVVAGIIGKKKYSYDCWSDITNTASRMESNGWNGYAQLTTHSFSMAKDCKFFKKREKLNVKGKGIMDTYVLNLDKFVI